MIRQNARPGAPGHNRIERRFRSGDMETRAALAEVCTALAGAGMGADDLGTTELVLAEVLNNVTEHAYSDGAGPVHLLLDMTTEGVVCRVRDRGHPMPRGELPNIPPPVIEPPDLLPEGGFGWHIIRSLASDLQMARQDGWNELSLVIPFADYGNMAEMNDLRADRG